MTSFYTYMYMYMLQLNNFMLFCRLVSVIYFLALTFSEDRQLHAATSKGELGEVDALQPPVPLWRKQPHKLR